MCGFAKKYMISLYAAENNTTITSNKRGRPLRLGPVNSMVVHLLCALRDRAGHVSSQLAITAAKVLMEKSDQSGHKCHLVIPGQKVSSNEWDGNKGHVPWAKKEFQMRQCFLFFTILFQKLKNIQSLLKWF